MRRRKYDLAIGKVLMDVSMVLFILAFVWPQLLLTNIALGIAGMMIHAKGEK